MTSTALATQGSSIVSDQKFKFYMVATDTQTLQARWDISPKNYLYRDKIAFSILDHTSKLGQPLWPPTQGTKNYPGIGKMPVYTGHLVIPIPVIASQDQFISIQIRYQGCSDNGVCYLPIRHDLTIDLRPPYGKPVYPSSSPSTDSIPVQHMTAPPAHRATEQDGITSGFVHHPLLGTLIGFFLFGLFLSLTPCVLPMIPILSAIITRQSKQNSGRGFFLSLAYVFGMALAYAMIGLIFGWMGDSLQTFFQHPAILIVFSGIFVLLALSLWGGYDLTLPARWQSSLAAYSYSKTAGSYLSTIVLGAASVLILSPCTTPALVGALGYITQTGHIVMGGLALFTMAIGMGVPLLLIGAFSKAILPKLGPWMHTIKLILGFLLFALAIWIIARLLPGVVSLFLWGILAISAAVTFGSFRTARTTAEILIKVLGIVLFIYGIVMLIGASLGHSNPFAPLYIKKHQQPTVLATPSFIPVQNLHTLQEQLQKAAQLHKITLLKFYADWCLSCQEMEMTTWRNPAVQAAMQPLYLLGADITQNTAAHRALQRHYKIVGPPTILFLDIHGQEIPHTRLVGKVSAQKLLSELQSLPTPTSEIDSTNSK